jgi:methionyl-tRNA formyltransferase
VILNNRCISFHTAPLPKYRGGNPIQNQMLDSKTESEVCSFITSESMDAGAVLLRTPISLLGNIDDVFREIARAVTMQITGILLNNPMPVMQGGEPTFCKRLTEEEKEIKPSMTVEYADALVRGFNGNPYTPAYVTMKDGRKLYILRAATMIPADMLKGLNAVADAKVCREEEKRTKT